MKYAMPDNDLTDRVRKLFARARNLEEKRMFGGQRRHLGIWRDGDTGYIFMILAILS